RLNHLRVDKMHLGEKAGRQNFWQNLLSNKFWIELLQIRNDTSLKE
ncbi:hypothetical protein L195_g063263, partial [Trifolium pratense]